MTAHSLAEPDERDITVTVLSRIPCYPNTDLLSEQNGFVIPTGTCYFAAVQDK
jgi:hypothetical protein